MPERIERDCLETETKMDVLISADAISQLDPRVFQKRFDALARLFADRDTALLLAYIRDYGPVPHKKVEPLLRYFKQPQPHLLDQLIEGGFILEGKRWLNISPSAREWMDYFSVPSGLSHPSAG